MMEFYLGNCGDMAVFVTIETFYTGGLACHVP